MVNYVMLTIAQLKGADSYRDQAQQSCKHSQWETFIHCLEWEAINVEHAIKLVQTHNLPFSVDPLCKRAKDAREAIAQHWAWYARRVAAN